MPAKLRSSNGPKAEKSGSMPFKRRETRPEGLMVKLTVPDYNRQRDLRIVTDSETESESEAETPFAEPKAVIRLRRSKRISLKRECDDSKDESTTVKRAAAIELKTERIKPRRSTRNINKARKATTRTAQPK